MRSYNRRSLLNSAARGRDLALILAGVSSVIFVLALPWNAFCATYGGLHCYAGGEAAFLGLVGLLTFEPGNWCWCANPLALFALCVIVFNLRRRRTALVCAGIALLVALAFPLFGHVSGFVFVTDNPDEDQHMPIVNLGLAYWLWLGSIVCACAAAIINRKEATP
jgi:hypothetical protein